LTIIIITVSVCSSLSIRKNWMGLWTVVDIVANQERISPIIHFLVGQINDWVTPALENM
jgi:hypothetical protein